MDSKEIKTALKEAREAIRTKDFKLAIKHCKAVLKADKENYNALVFVGVAAQELNESDQAVAAFRRAIEAAPEQLLAWQGLCAFYEKSESEEHKTELLEVYSKLVELHDGDRDKQFAVLGKLAQVLLEKKDLKQCVETLQKQYLAVRGDEEKEVEVQSAIIRALRSEQSLSPGLTQLLEESLEKCLSSATCRDTKEKEEWFIMRITLLWQKEDAVKAIDETRNVLQTYPDCVAAMELLCKGYVDAVVFGQNAAVVYSDIANITTTLLEQSSTYRFGRLAKMARLYTEKDIQGIAEILASSVPTPKTLSQCILLTNCHEVIHKYDGVIKFADQGLKLCGEDEQTVKSKSLILSKLFAFYYIGSEDDVAFGIAQLKKLQSEFKDDAKCLALLIRLCLKMNKVADAKELLEQFAVGVSNDSLVNGLRGMCSRAEGNLEVARQQLEDSLQQGLSVEGINVFWELALTLRELKTYAESGKYLLQALKQDPFNPKLYLEMGHHYKLLNDYDKVVRCYQRAFSLNSKDAEAGATLSDAYVETGAQELNLQLLTSVTETTVGTSAKWAWIRLGLQYLKFKDPTSAVKALQATLRIDPKDSWCWEALADAYLARGSFTSAFKSYSWALELGEEESVYCRYQMASIKHMLQEYTEAVSIFQKVLVTDGNYVPALKGFGEAMLCQAQNHLKDYFHGLAKDCLEEALAVLSKAAFLQPDLSCIWKLLGDACTIASHLPLEMCNLQVSSRLVPSGGDGAEVVRVERKDLLQLGARCYAKAISISSDNSLLWHDLGINYYYQAKGVGSTTDLWERSLLALKNAIRLEPKDTFHWNALGVVATGVSNYALAQHAFIQSVQLDKNNAIAWANLGVLYLMKDNVELAHQAFSKAQSIEPSYINSWIGMALIAEKVSHADAMDLFRHTTSLGNHNESAIGYANFVTGTLFNRTNKISSELYNYWIVKMAAIPSASDCLAKYTDQNRANAQALNMYGLLLEKQGLYSSAIKVFEKSLSIVQSESDKKKVDCVRSNFARTLSTVGRYRDAVEQFQLIKEPDFYSQCQLALAHFKLEQYTESYQAYESAIHWLAENDEEKSHVFVAMAMVAFKMNDVEKAKTLLFQSSVLQPPSVPGLLALCTLGLLQSDLTLANAAVQELLRFARDKDYVRSITLLVACTFLVQGKGKLARNQICKAVHENPSVASLWSLLSYHLLQFPQAGTKAATKCASAAKKLVTMSLASTVYSAAPSTYKAGSLESFCNLVNGSVKESLRCTQKAVHLNPGDVTNWSSLLSAVVAQDPSYCKAMKLVWFPKLIAFVQSEVKQTMANCSLLGAWLTWYEVLLHLSTGLGGITEDTKVKQASQSSEFGNVIFKALIDCMVAKLVNTQVPIASLQQEVLQKPSDNFGWQALFRSYIVLGDCAHAKEIALMWIECAKQTGQPQIQVLALLFLAEMSLSQKETLSDEENWLAIAEEATLAALKLDASCKAAHYIHAVVLFRKKMTRKVKYSLQKVVAGSTPDLGYGLLQNWAEQVLQQLNDDEKNENS